MDTIIPLYVSKRKMLSADQSQRRLGQHGPVGMPRVIVHRHRAAAQPGGLALGVELAGEAPNFEARIWLVPEIIFIADNKQMALQHGAPVLTDLVNLMVPATRLSPLVT